jgi:ESS family glutamate:Na+ symporter
MSDLEWLFFSLVLIWGILVVAHYIRKTSKLLAKLFLPGSIVAGVLALLLGPDILGNVVTIIAPQDLLLAKGLIPEQVLTAWEALPGIFINVVFAALFLGKLIPGIKSIWRRSAPVITYGHIVAWGQYVVGFLLAILILEPFFDLNPMAGALIEIGFEGGHGTAAGMAPVFNELGFSEGADLALGIATAGLVLAILTGTILINWAARNGKLNSDSRALDVNKVPSDMGELLETKPTYRKAATSHIIDPLSFHLGLIGISIFIGWCLLTDIRHGRQTKVFAVTL